MDIALRPVLGFLSDPLNRCPRRLSLADERISVRGGAKSWIGFEEIASRPSGRRVGCCRHRSQSNCLIAYECEPTYEHKLTGTGRRVYTPDFRLTESGVYLEHFGVRRTRGADGKEHLTTAPFADRDARSVWDDAGRAARGGTSLATTLVRRLWQNRIGGGQEARQTD